MNLIISELKKFSDKILELNPPVEETEIEGFEKKYGLQLPEDYKEVVHSFSYTYWICGFEFGTMLEPVLFGIKKR